MIDFGLAEDVFNLDEEDQSELKNEDMNSLGHVLKCIDEKRAHIRIDTGSNNNQVTGS